MVGPIPRLVRLVLVAALPAAALAAPGPEANCPPIDLPVPAAHAAAVRAFIDPVTGRLRPATPEERRKAAAAAARSRDRSGRSYEVVLHPDGTRVVELDDAFMTSLTVTRNPDGTLSHACRTGPPAPAGAGTGK